MSPLTGRVELSPYKRTRVALKYNLGFTARRIAFEEGVSPNSVSGIARRYAVQKSAQSSPRSGRPPKLSERDKRHIFSSY
jgi:transposase